MLICQLHKLYSSIYIWLFGFISFKFIFPSDFNKFTDIILFLNTFNILVNKLNAFIIHKVLMALFNMIYINKNLQYIIKTIIKA